MHTLAQLSSGELTGIKRLNLSENLQTFPKVIYNLAESLEILDLSHNQLTELPDDFTKLHQLKVIFLSNNPFTLFPKVLGKCANLEMVGLKSCQITQIPENSFPKKLRWLILTDNQLSELPNAIGQCHRLEKLMLAGNQLTNLPDTLAQCQDLALLRVSANQLTQLPNWLWQLPKLAWLAFSGNPLCPNSSETLAMQAIGFNEFYCGKLLGEGASGHIYQASWQDINHPLQAEHVTFAVKIFKGQVTSDGYPEDELATSLQVKNHPGLVKIIGHFEHHSQKPEESVKKGILMGLIPNTYQNLGLPPSLSSCTRDTFASNRTLSLQQTLKILRSVADSMAHLHQQGICHGDLYAHNLLYNAQADVLFGDFGAASVFRHLPLNQQMGIQQLEIRAFGHLIDDLLTLTPTVMQTPVFESVLTTLTAQCSSPSQETSLNFKALFEQLNTLEACLT